MGIDSGNKETVTASAPSPPATMGESASAKAHSLSPKPAGENLLFRKDTAYGDWRDYLVRDGYVVVKGAIPKERAEQYGGEMMSFLETLSVLVYMFNPLSSSPQTPLFLFLQNQHQ